MRKRSACFRNFSNTGGRSARNANVPRRQAKSRILSRWCESWGGVSLVYRKRLQDSPAYRLNHEEVQKALEEGIDFIECMNPTEAVPDEFNAVKALIFERLEYVAEDRQIRKHRRDARVSRTHGLRRGGHRRRMSFTKRKSPAHSSSTSGGSSSSRTRSSETATGISTRPRPEKARPDSLPPTSMKANSSATTATTTRNTPATSSRRWPRPSTATNEWCEHFCR